MGKVVRTTLSLIVTLVLFSVVALAQAAGNKTDKDKGQEHSSRLAKLAFWRHDKNHQNSGRNAQAQAKPAQSKQAQARAAQIKPSPARAAAKKDQNQGQHASKISKVPTKKTSAANKTKPQEKPKDRTTASLQQ